jgi:hypothetical protein
MAPLFFLFPFLLAPVKHTSLAWIHLYTMSESDIEKELALLKRRWGSSMEVLGVQYEGDVGAAACFTISLPPTDPDFSVLLRKLEFLWAESNGP